MSDPIKDQLIVDPFEYGKHTRNMVNIPDIWSKYQIYRQHTRNMVKVPGMSDPIKDQLIVDPFEYGQHTRYMVDTRHTAV